MEDQLAGKHGVPVIGLAGTLGEGSEYLHEHGFNALVPIVEGPVSLDYAIENAEELLERAGARIARLISIKR